MKRTLERDLVFVSVLAIVLLFTVSISYATPDLTAECGTEGCHSITGLYTMTSNTTGNATLGVPFTLRINATKQSGGPGFWMALKSGWADNDQFNFTPAAIQDNSAGDLNSTALIITCDFTFIPESVGNWTIRAWCATQNWAMSLDIPISVPVIPDETPPAIDSPSDIEYDVYSTGHSIIWVPFDEHPSSFYVRVNGVTILSGGWNGQPVVVNVDYLIPGIYEYICTVFDASGNNATDSVTVTVTGEVITTTTETSTTTTTTPTASSSTTSTTPTTSTGGNPGIPSDNEEVLTTATFSLIMLASGGIVGVLILVIIVDQWRGRK
jgi:hypothetical protein